MNSVFGYAVTFNTPTFTLAMDLDLYEKLTRFCAYRDRCKSEVVTKMVALKLEKDEQPEYIKKLQEDNYLNEDRFVKAFVNGHLRKKWGKVKIKSALLRKGIKVEQMQPYLDNVEEEDYTEKILKLATAKMRTIKGKTVSEKRMKLIKYLLGKGYEMPKVLAAIKPLKF
ncbi:MAG: RecX family transcriptional regulator [Chitinophagales bacterium]